MCRLRLNTGQVLFKVFLRSSRKSAIKGSCFLEKDRGRGVNFLMKNKKLLFTSLNLFVFVGIILSLIFVNCFSDELEVLKKILEQNGLSIQNFVVYTSWDQLPKTKNGLKPLGCWYLVEKDKIVALGISSWTCTELNLSNLQSLKYLDLSFNLSLERVLLFNLDKLEALDLRLTFIKDLRIAELPSLKYLDLSSNFGLRSVVLVNLDRLEYLNFGYCEMNSLRLSNLPALKEIRFCGRGFGSLRRVYITNLNKLERLHLVCCKIEDLHLSNLPSLKDLDLSDNEKLKKVDLVNFTNLRKINLRNCGIDNLKLSRLPKSLEQLDLSGNAFQELDLTEFDKLIYLSLRECPSLRSVKVSKKVKGKILIHGFPIEKVIYE